MSCHVHTFDAREGGSFRISLTYDVPTGTGKTAAHTDTYHGRFVKLVPNKQLVEVDEFETEGGTNLLAVHEGLPIGVSPAATKLAGRWLWRS